MFAASILIGSVSFFGYWSINQLNQVFDTLSVNLSAASVAHTQTVSSFLEKEAVVASTSPVLFNVFATSTPTSKVGTSTESVGADLGAPFTFLQKETGLYSGCAYSISVQASTTIASLEVTLVDAKTRDPVAQKISGLSKENALEKSQEIPWKVGAVSPGAYYIKIVKARDAKSVVRSSVFNIQSIPEGLSVEEKESLCI